MHEKLKKLLLLALPITFLLAACEERQSDVVSYNLSKEADNFNIVRRLNVINAIQGDILFSMEGRLSIEEDGRQLEITVQEGEDKFKKHFVGLSDNVTYVIEDVTGTETDPYNYIINYNPKMWVPVTVQTID